MKSNTAIILFVYNRLEHSIKTIKALVRDPLTSNIFFFVYSDGPKPGEDPEIVEKVRKEIRQELEKNSIAFEIIERTENVGLAANIISGLGNVFEKYESAIIFEDDIVCGDNAVSYAIQCLERFKENEEIMHISLYTPIKRLISNKAYLSNIMFCWGWATWKRSWSHFQKNVEKTISETSLEEIKRFSFDGALSTWEQIELNYEGKLNTWACFWSYSIFKKNGFCVTPPFSLVRNIGNDGSGTNSGASDIFNVAFENKQVCIKTALKECPRLERKILAFFKSMTSNHSDRLAILYTKIKKVLL